MINPDNNTINRIPSDDEGSHEEHPITPVNLTNKPSKDFKKILGKGSKEGKDDERKKSPANLFAQEQAHADFNTEELAIKSDKEEAERASEGVASIFDLQVKSESKDFHEAQAAAKVESPSDLFKRMSTPRTTRPDAYKKAGVSPSELSKHQTPDRYNHEQMDLSYVNPLALQSQLAASQANASAIDTKVQQPAGVDANMALMVKQIEDLIKKMYTVKTPGQTDLVMLINKPDHLFNDAKITVSSFDSAKGQINISIENLTQQAQKVIELDKNKKALLDELEQKGYTVQIFTATTSKIENVAISEQATQHDREQQEEDGSSERRHPREQA